jgi:FkbM family methyltransferase
MKYLLVFYFWFNFIILYIYSFLLKRKKISVTKIGSRLGGWYVPLSWLNSKSICYCAGAGEDITFDLGLIKLKKGSVFCFDPTPRAKKHVLAHTKGVKKFNFLEYGLWNKNISLKFFAPVNPNHVSHSITNLHHTQSFFIGKCKRLQSIMKELHHQQLDLLKIDIEGAEYTVLNDMIKSSIFPRILCIEFDQPTSVLKTIKMMSKLEQHNYLLVKQDHFNFTFIHNPE